MSVLLALALVLYVAIAIVLVYRYLRTRDVGFIWLGVALVIWPGGSRLLQVAEKALIDRFVGHPAAVFFPFSLVRNGQMTLGSLVESFALFHQIIGFGLLLVAVLYLSKAKGGSPNTQATV